MNRYALILIDLFDESMLNGVNYPVCIEHEKWKMLEYTYQADPIGDDWVIFEGEDANVKCAEFLDGNGN